MGRASRARGDAPRLSMRRKFAYRDAGRVDIVERLSSRDPCKSSSIVQLPEAVSPQKIEGDS